MASRARRALLLTLVAAVVLTACGGDGDETASPSTTTTTAGGSTTAPVGDPPLLAQQCEGTELDVGYPEGWHTTTDGNGSAPERAVVGPCRFFDREPIEPMRGGEPERPLAISFSIEPRYELLLTGFDDGHDELEHRDELRVDDHEAVRFETRSSGGAEQPADTRTTSFVVDLEPLALVASTSDAGGLPYEENQDVLAMMVSTIDILDAPRCSGSRADVALASQDIPDPVASMRSRIAEAAQACDYDELDEAADASDAFTYSFGAAELAPSAYWRALEAGGGDPMWFLAEILARPVRAVPGSDPPRYAWPSAFTYDSWSDVPQPAREALRPLYDETDFQGFASFGGYVGWRVGITADGSWSYFVRGD